MEHLIDKIIEIHRLGREVDKEIGTCGTISYASPRWHIFVFEDFMRVAKSLGETPTVDTSCADRTYAAKYVFWHRGVEVFCLLRREEEAHDANATN